MPDAKNNAKMTGDTHLPDVESEFDVEEANAQGAGTGGTPGDRDVATERGDQAVPGRGGKKAGLLKDSDAQDRSPGSSGTGSDSESAGR
jgi:hypothetical protein